MHEPKLFSEEKDKLFDYYNLKDLCVNFNSRSMALLEKNNSANIVFKSVLVNRESRGP